KIQVQQSIYDENDRIAAQLNGMLSRRGIVMVNVMGAPGVGKTSVIRGVIEGLACKCLVVEGDIESDIDTAALKAAGIDAVQINTHGACHLDAPVVDAAVRGLENLDAGVLFIENIGNLVCPAEFSIGEHVKMLVVTAADGSDKPYKYPLAFEKADVIVLNKADLLPYVDFDNDFFLKGVRALNPRAPVFAVSMRTGDGVGQIVQWMNETIHSRKA
ncbi:MAG: hydrogenase nickel incorporation protein HypB, partial [Eubacteriales bacterium]|nr:hydrogenase nickel incorporation protein HypB [Eubacteriales bacterium]